MNLGKTVRNAISWTVAIAMLSIPVLPQIAKAEDNKKSKKTLGRFLSEESTASAYPDERTTIVYEDPDYANNGKSREKLPTFVASMKLEGSTPTTDFVFKEGFYMVEVGDSGKFRVVTTPRKVFDTLGNDRGLTNYDKYLNSLAKKTNQLVFMVEDESTPEGKKKIFHPVKVTPAPVVAEEISKIQEIIFNYNPDRVDELLALSTDYTPSTEQLQLLRRKKDSQLIVYDGENLEEALRRTTKSPKVFPGLHTSNPEEDTKRINSILGITLDYLANFVNSSLTREFNVSKILGNKNSNVVTTEEKEIDGVDYKIYHTTSGMDVYEYVLQDGDKTRVMRYVLFGMPDPLMLDIFRLAEGKDPLYIHALIERARYEKARPANVPDLELITAVSLEEEDNKRKNEKKKKLKFPLPKKGSNIYDYKVPEGFVAIRYSDPNDPVVRNRPRITDFYRKEDVKVDGDTLLVKKDAERVATIQHKSTGEVRGRVYNNVVTRTVVPWVTPNWGQRYVDGQRAVGKTKKADLVEYVAIPGLKIVVEGAVIYAIVGTGGGSTGGGGGGTNGGGVNQGSIIDPWD